MKWYETLALVVVTAVVTATTMFGLFILAVYRALNH